MFQDIHTSKFTEKYFLNYLFCKNLFFVGMGVYIAPLVYPMCVLPVDGMNPWLEFHGPRYHVGAKDVT